MRRGWNLQEKTNHSTTYKLTKRGSSSKYFPTRGFWISICFTSWKIQIFTSLYLLNNKASAKQCSGVCYKQWSIAHQNLEEYRLNNCLMIASHQSPIPKPAVIQQTKVIWILRISMLKFYQSSNHRWHHCKV